MLRLTPILLSALLAPQIHAAGKTDDALRGWEAKQQVVTKLYDTAFKRLENQLRVAAILDACGNSGLAQAIDPPDERANLLLQFVAEDRELGRAFMKLTESERVDVAYMVDASLSGYRQGVNAGLVVSNGVMTDKNRALICQFTLKMADNLLLERKK